MLTLQELKDSGVKYNQCRWKLRRASDMIKTCEFSNDWEYWNVNYASYLALWANRLNAKSHPFTATSDKFIVVKVMYHDHWMITLVERLED